jgi:small redox-active disulfide protein 2
MKKVLVLGTGCPKCKKLYEAAVQVVTEGGLDAEVSKVEDINAILGYGVMMTPALVVDGEVKAVGRIPRPDEIRCMLS